MWFPQSQGSRLRDPASPKRGFSRFGVQSRSMTSRSITARRTLDDQVRPSSISIARCSPAPPARCSPRRCSRPGSSAARSPARRCCSACSTPSARRCRRWPWPARPSTFAKGKSRAAVQQAAASAAERLVGDGAAAGRAAVRRAPRRRPAGRDGHHDARTTWSNRSPTCWASTTSSPPATRSTTTAPTTARSTGRSCGVPASSPRSREWAEEHGVDLAESYAYSDSVYDTPLLAAVGHPFVVNPDPRMALMAAARRWPTLDLSARTASVSHGQDPGRQPGDPAAGAQLHPPAVLPVRQVRHRRASRTSPNQGPAIIVGNHRSYFDPMAMAVTIARTDRTVRFLGKKEVFDAPIVGQIAAAMGGIRVDRGTGSDEPLQAAAEALERRRHGGASCRRAPFPRARRSSTPS